LSVERLLLVTNSVQDVFPQHLRKRCVKKCMAFNDQWRMQRSIKPRHQTI